MADQDRVVVKALVHRSTATEIAQLAAREDRSVASVIRTAISDYLKQKAVR